MGVESSGSKSSRLFWMDNLRSITIFLVVLYHVGGVYEGAGLWGSFWIVDDPTTITWVGIVGIIFDVFVMPMMFFIAGYLALQSIRNKSWQEFLKSKFKRLMIPWTLAVATLIPLYKFIFLYSRNLPQEHWTTYFHITNQNSQNWLWFLPVLFLFNVIFVLGSKLNLKLPKLSVKMAISSALLIGLVYSYGIGSLFGMRSWTLTPILDFENERLLLYFLTYLLGALYCQKGAFDTLSESKLMYNIMNGIAWIPITIHIIARLVPFFSPEGFTVTPMYRLVWWLSFYVSLLSLMYLMVETFRRYFDKTGNVWSALNRNSYGVYIIHVISIGVFGTILLNTSLPVLVKYPLLIVLTYWGSNLMVSGYKYVFQKRKA